MTEFTETTLPEPQVTKRTEYEWPWPYDTAPVVTEDPHFCRSGRTERYVISDIVIEEYEGGDPYEDDRPSVQVLGYRLTKDGRRSQSQTYRHTIYSKAVEEAILALHLARKA